MIAMWEMLKVDTKHHPFHSYTTGIVGLVFEGFWPIISNISPLEEACHSHPKLQASPPYWSHPCQVLRLQAGRLQL